MKARLSMVIKSSLDLLSVSTWLVWLWCLLLRSKKEINVYHPDLKIGFTSWQLVSCYHERYPPISHNGRRYRSCCRYNCAEQLYKVSLVGDFIFRANQRAHEDNTGFCLASAQSGRVCKDCLRKRVQFADASHDRILRCANTGGLAYVAKEADSSLILHHHEVLERQYSRNLTQ